MGQKGKESLLRGILVVIHNLKGQNARKKEKEGFKKTKTKPKKNPKIKTDKQTNNKNPKIKRILLHGREGFLK